MNRQNVAAQVHCHIGSLEKKSATEEADNFVHCHIGSLEIIKQVFTFHNIVHCHIGSLENQ